MQTFAGTSSSSAFAPRLDDADLLAALRDQLAKAIDRLRELRSMPIDPSIADEIAEIRFFAARLGRRLRALGQDGLLHVSVVSSHSLIEVLQAAVEEIREECGRRGIDARIEIEDTPPPMWVDRDQLIEALRCSLDDAMSSGRTQAIIINVAETHGQVELTVRAQDGEGSTEIDGPRFEEPAILRHEVARRLLDLMGGQTQLRVEDNFREVTLHLPPGRAPGAVQRERSREGRVFVFPTPTAA